MKASFKYIFASNKFAADNLKIGNTIWNLLSIASVF